MNFEFALARGLDKTNESFLPQDVADMMYTSVIGVAMMTLQNAWISTLQKDANQINDDYNHYAGDSSAQSEHLQLDQMQYEVDNAEMNTQVGIFQSMFDGAKQQTTNDTNSESNFTLLANAVLSIPSSTFNLINGYSKI